jgi:hypothetical protein
MVSRIHKTKVMFKVCHDIIHAAITNVSTEECPSMNLSIVSIVNIL